MRTEFKVPDIWDYLVWSDHRMLNILESISEKDYEYEFSGLAGSIKSKSSHIVSIYDFFISIFKGEPLASFPDRSGLTKKELLELWRDDLRKLKVFANSAHDFYPLPLANNQRVAARHIILDACLHTVHHRGQLLTMLRMLGKGKDDIHPRDTNMDYLTYLFALKPNEILPAPMDNEK